MPPELLRRVRIAANGEVSWPLVDAARAVNALADAGQLVLGLEVEEFDDKGITVTPWSFFEPDELDRAEANVRRAREAALEALTAPGLADHGDWVLVDWRES
jgi:hypothetical protein